MHPTAVNNFFSLQNVCSPLSPPLLSAAEVSPRKQKSSNARKATEILSL